MPNPLSRVHSTAFVTLGPIAFDHQPPLAHGIALIVTSWAYVEYDLAMALARLLRADPAATVAVYSSVKSTTVQRAMLASAANAMLAGKDLKLFRAILSLASSAAEQRNKIVHGLWGYSVDLQGRLLRVSPDHLLAVETDPLHPVTERFHSWTFDPQHRRKIEVYTIKEIWELYERIVNVSRMFAWFWRMLDAPASKRAKHRRRLSDEPAMQKTLNRKKGPRKTPSSRQRQRSPTRVPK